MKRRQAGPRVAKFLEAFQLLASRPLLVVGALMLSIAIQTVLVMLNAYIGMIMGFTGEPISPMVAA